LTAVSSPLSAAFEIDMKQDVGSRRKYLERFRLI
jgi:hypothetical protein